MEFPGKIIENFMTPRVGNGRKRTREEVGKIPEAEQEFLERLDLGMGRFSPKKKHWEKRRWEQEFQAEEKLWDNPGREFVWIRE